MKPSSQRLPGILWLGLIQGPSGYADEARGFLRVLERAGHGPSARHLFGPADARLGSEDGAMLRKQFARSADDATVAVHHYAPGWLPRAPVVEGVPNVARTMFETDRIPSAWLAQLLLRDQVWVPTEHNRDAFERGGIPSGRLRVVGGTLDFETFRAGAEPLALGTPADHFVFLSNFEFSERKAWRVLLHAWARAFAPTDPVCLVLKTTADTDGSLRHRIDSALADAADAAGRSDTAPVQLLARTISPVELAGMYAAADAYVLPSRGEGWGRPYMEALAMGLPTIASRWSGPTEFMREETSWLVDGQLVPVPADHGVFVGDVSGHRWFDPDLDLLTAALADVASDPKRSRERAAGARADLLERFGPEATMRKLEAALREVTERAGEFAATGRECTIRGPFGRNASMAIVNDRLLASVEATGRRVHPRPQGAGPEDSQGPTISQSWPPDFTPGSHGHSVVVLHWEYGHPPAEWVDRIRRDVDRVVVASEYVRQGYIAGGVPPGIVEVVPCGVDLTEFHPDGPAVELHASAECVFLFVGGTIWRKGIDLLMAAWEQAFTADDNVLLVVKDFGVSSHYRGQTQGAAVQALSRRDGLAPIVYLNEEVPASELPALYRAADILVAPYRGEGFGMPILEAMACGIPAIHTAIGPSSEFVGDGGWAIPARRIGLGGRVASGPLAGEGYVHEVEIAALARTLRQAATDRDERRRRGAIAAARARDYGWERAGALIERVLGTLAAEGLPLARCTQQPEIHARSRMVLYAPDWNDEVSWSEALRRWAAAVPADADVTLLMPVLESEADAVMHRVLSKLTSLGVDIAALGDLALHQQLDREFSGLVAVADAVLLDRRQASEPPPELWRRARYLLTVAPGELENFTAMLELLPEQPVQAA